jgi:type I restriction enzyme, S subunit
MKPGWRLAPFDSVMADESGGNLKTPQREFLPVGRYAVVDQGKQLVAGYVNDESRLCRVELPAIVFGDHTRCFKYVDFPFCMGADGTKVLRPKIDADVKYLYHYLRQLRLTEGGYDRHFKYLKRTEIVLPSLPEQRRIAALLDQAEALRAKRLTALAQLDLLTQSIFLDMFGEPTTNPKGWPSSALGNVTATTSGGTPDRMVLEYFGGGIPWVKSGELHQRIVTATEETLTQRGLKESSAKLMPPGTVLVAMYGATVGTSAILGVEAATNQAVCCILPTQELLADYLVHLLERLAPTLLAKRVGGAQPNLSQQLIRQLVIPLPPCDLQQVFVSRVREVDRVRVTHCLSLTSFDALFSSIQALAFMGEV